jgi:hypothetical protein
VFLKIGESSGATGCHFHLDSKSANFPSGKNQGGDLRFTASDGTTLLSFWVESVSGTSPNRIAYVWVKVSADLGTSQDIYCYFGNASATNSSDGANTFLFFDDFSGTSLDTTKWNSYIISGGSLTVANDELKLDAAIVCSKLESFSSFCLETKARATSGYEINIYAQASRTPSSLTPDGYQFQNSNALNRQHSIIKALDQTESVLANSTFGILGNVSYIVRAIKLASSLANIRFNLNYTQLTSVSATDTTYSALYPGLRADGTGRGTMVTYYDWVRVRKYVSPEPAFDSASGIQVLPSSRRLFLMPI